MLKDITLGQYFPGSTVAHRLDPRTKILLVVLYIVALFCAKGAVGYAVMALVLLTCARISKVKFKSLVRGLKPVLFIIIFTAIMNLFFTPGENYIFELGFLRVSAEGLRNAFFMVLRIMMLIMCIALRFIPTLIEETDKIMSAQKARGADFESGNLIQKAKAMLPILVPLFVSAFRRADELATAMECRCYHGGEGRTKLHVLKYESRDYIALALGAAVLALILTLRKFVS